VKDYFSGILVGSILGAAAAIYYFNEETKIKLGVNRGVRQVMAKKGQAKQFISNIECELGHIIRK
jgi:gas vesicle protein